MKKLSPILLLLVLAALAVAVSFWRGRIKERPVIVTEPPAAEQQSQPPDTPAPVSTAGWKTYTNEKLGYQIKFPSEWSFDEDKESGIYIWREPQLLEGVCIKQVSVGTTDLSIDDYIKDFRTADIVDGVELNHMSLMGDYNLVGNQGKLLRYGVAEGTGGYDIFVSKNGKNYIISVDQCGGNFPSNTTSSILSTFKFIN